jgi:hypothetical protein
MQLYLYCKIACTQQVETTRTVAVSSETTKKDIGKTRVFGFGVKEIVRKKHISHWYLPTAVVCWLCNGLLLRPLTAEDGTGGVLL